MYWNDFSGFQSWPTEQEEGDLAVCDYISPVSVGAVEGSILSVVINVAGHVGVPCVCPCMCLWGTCSALLQVELANRKATAVSLSLGTDLRSPSAMSWDPASRQEESPSPELLEVTTLIWWHPLTGPSEEQGPINVYLFSNNCSTIVNAVVTAELSEFVNFFCMFEFRATKMVKVL